METPLQTILEMDGIYAFGNFSRNGWNALANPLISEHFFSFSGPGISQKVSKIPFKKFWGWIKLSEKATLKLLKKCATICNFSLNV